MIGGGQQGAFPIAGAVLPACSCLTARSQLAHSSVCAGLQPLLSRDERARVHRVLSAEGHSDPAPGVSHEKMLCLQVPIALQPNALLQMPLLHPKLFERRLQAPVGIQTLTALHVARVQPGEWLNEEVINLYLSLVCKKSVSPSDLFEGWGGGGGGKGMADRPRNCRLTRCSNQLVPRRRHCESRS